jgi:hypothetical protein
MTEHEQKLELQALIVEDIMSNIFEDDNLGIVRDALWNYLDLFTNAELEQQAKERGNP